MLVFLNIDCLLPMAPLTADAAGPAESLGLAGFESVLDAWPPLHVVITSELRYRMTIEQLRSLFAPRCRPRVIATSLLYGALAHGSALGREQEILHWLRHAGAESADWLALDHRHADFQLHADRLLACTCFDRTARADLNARLLQWAGRQPSAMDVDHHAVVGAPAGTLGVAAPLARAWG
jgi:hypothetical protein